MYNWIKLNKEVQTLFDKAREMENNLILKIIKESDVVISTNSSAGIEELENIRFDTVVIDEGSQATEPSCYIPLFMEKKLLWEEIISNYHQQY
ncbi:AAA domain-containing protein [Marinitoga lauensis]|uniref:AAA domain-containing protein n=1 Tax=Marinitoga lauensis TaxID=2201189 RepID=UPI001982633C|nr:AAA domain-containing protein [Marinitoga lauensis]